MLYAIIGMKQQQNKTKVLMESNDHKLFALFYSFLLSAFFIENHHQKLRKIMLYLQMILILGAHIQIHFISQ